MSRDRPGEQCKNRIPREQNALEGLFRTVLESGGQFASLTVVPRNRTRDLAACVRHRCRASATSLLLAQRRPAEAGGVERDRAPRSHPPSPTNYHPAANLPNDGEVYPTPARDGKQRATRPLTALWKLGSTKCLSQPARIAVEEGEREGTTEGRAKRRWHPVATWTRRKPLRVRLPLLPLLLTKMCPWPSGPGVCLPSRKGGFDSRRAL
jgi:hypothetical protein